MMNITIRNTQAQFNDQDVDILFIKRIFYITNKTIASHESSGNCEQFGIIGAL